MPIPSSRCLPLALATLALASPSFASGATITFLGGMNVANVTGKNATFAPQSKLGFVSGVAFAFPLNDRFAIAPEAGYTLRGFSWGTSDRTDVSGNFLGTFETLTVTEVLTLACTCRATFPLAGAFKANIAAGPTVGFENSENFTTLTSSSRGNTPNDFLRDIDFGLLAAVGCDAATGPGRLGLGVRSVMGLSDLSRDPRVTRRTRVVEFVAGYTASLGH